MKPLACQLVDIIFYVGCFIRQQRSKGVFPIRIRFQEALRVFVREILPDRAVEKVSGLLLPIARGKRSVPHLVGFEGSVPLRVKRQGAHKIHNRIARNLIENFRNHFVRLSADPVVDCGLRRIVEGRAVNLCGIAVCILLQERIFHMQRVRVLHPDGIGSFQLLVIFQRRLQHGKTGVQAPRIRAEYPLHLRLRLAHRAVCRHGKRACHAQGRDQRVFLLHFVLQKLCAEAGQCRGGILHGRSIVKCLRLRILCALRQVPDRSGACRAAGSREHTGSGKKRRKKLFAFHG